MDELGRRCLKVGGDGQCSARNEVFMATLQAATTRHCHNEKLSGILNTNHSVPKSKINHGEGGLSNNGKTKLARELAERITLCE